jgi:hypothetical protein
VQRSLGVCPQGGSWQWWGGAGKTRGPSSSGGHSAGWDLRGGSWISPESRRASCDKPSSWDSSSHAGWWARVVAKSKIDLVPILTLPIAGYDTGIWSTVYMIYLQDPRRKKWSYPQTMCETKSLGSGAVVELSSADWDFCIWTETFI